MVRGNRHLLRIVAPPATGITRDITDNAERLSHDAVAVDDAGLFAGGAEPAPDDRRVSRHPMRAPQCCAWQAPVLPTDHEPKTRPYPMNRTTTSPFDIKSATIQGLSLVLRSTNIGVIDGDLAARVASAGDLFTNAPVLINVSALTSDGTADKLELTRLINLLRRHTMRAVGIVGATGLLLKQAHALGLMEEEEVQPRVRRDTPQPEPESASAPVVAMDPTGEATDGQPMADLFADTPLAPPPAESASPQETAPAAGPASAAQTTPTMVVDRPLRSGQRIYARGGDLVVLGVVSHGAEVIADGNIHVYGPLRGRAIAGANGDTDARIFAAVMEPELLSIAGTYRTTDKPLADEVHGKPAQVRLHGDKMLIEPLKS
jgi:septum site-determining protein MinC